MSRSRDHHVPCPCGAELADECPRCNDVNPLGSMQIEPAIGSSAMCPLHPATARPCWECGVARVRAAMTPTQRPTATDTHGRALARARADRTNRTEQP